MTERLREQLSALADDELDHGEVALLLRQYGGSDELRDCWHAYHVIGEVIRRGFPTADAGCVANRVRAVLDTDATVEPAARPPAARRWMTVLRPVGAAAVAASVSLVAVMLVRAPTPAGSSPAPAEVVPPQAYNAARVPGANFDYAAMSSVRWDQGSPAVRRELNEYLLDHNEDAPTLGRQGMLPYLHLATFYASVPPAAHRASTGVPRAGEGHRE
ncbi:MAG TPA: sigma-E factor negative regulatory protein [Gammaproteobacteria bacterium]|nr:sigma-E factor negative regulatory protein [Gammaproteobacteria bacterium]